MFTNAVPGRPHKLLWLQDSPSHEKQRTLKRSPQLAGANALEWNESNIRNQTSIETSTTTTLHSILFSRVLRSELREKLKISSFLVENQFDSETSIIKGRGAAPAADWTQKDFKTIRLISDPREFSRVSRARFSFSRVAFSRVPKPHNILCHLDRIFHRSPNCLWTVWHHQGRYLSLILFQVFLGGGGGVQTASSETMFWRMRWFTALVNFGTSGFYLPDFRWLHPNPDSAVCLGFLPQRLFTFHFPTVIRRLPWTYFTTSGRHQDSDAVRITVPGTVFYPSSGWLWIIHVFVWGRIGT